MLTVDRSKDIKHYTKNQEGTMEQQKKRRYTRRTCAAFAGPIHRTTEIRGLGAAARRCGCSHTHLRKVLEGERKPSADLERRMRRLGLTPGELKKEGKI